MDRFSHRVTIVFQSEKAVYHKVLKLEVFIY